LVAAVVGVAVVLAVFGGAHFYVARRLYQWLALVFPGINGKVFAGVYVCLAVAIIVGYLPLPAVVRRTFAWVGGHWTGAFVYLLMAFVVVDLVLAVGRLVRVVPSPVPTDVRFVAGLVAVLVATGVVSYGVYNATQIRSVDYDVTVSADLEPTRIVVVSDLHLGSVGSEDNLVRVVDAVNAARPDIVCLVGDTFNDDYHAVRDPDKVAELFASITSTYGVYAVLGNHDSGASLPDMVGLLERSGVRLLNDEHVTVGPIVLVGRMDASPIRSFGGLERASTAEVFASVDTTGPVVVMDHNPAHVDDDPQVDLVVSGHTHRGQMFPANLITRAMYTVDYGHHQGSGSQVVVTSGAGTWGIPMRVGSSSEIAVITLHGPA
ncbi:MAG: metallophosphoesterase, partial [Micrococcales bacterium]|nr:metallophosphoesterase [Micrococcales bacterium]